MHRRLHPVSRRVLLARGISGPDALTLSMQRLHRPDGWSGIDKAAGLLADAIIGDRSVLVVGDFDADGATGTALAVLSLRAMGGQRISFRVPNRFEFGYGLTVPLVETLAAEPPDLLITVDAGIACVAGVQRAREMGVGTPSWAKVTDMVLLARDGAVKGEGWWVRCPFEGQGSEGRLTRPEEPTPVCEPTDQRARSE